MTAAVALRRPWYQHLGFDQLLDGPDEFVATPGDEQPRAARLLADYEHELGDHVVACMSQEPFRPARRGPAPPPLRVLTFLSAADEWADIDRSKVPLISTALPPKPDKPRHPNKGGRRGFARSRRPATR